MNSLFGANKISMPDAVAAYNALRIQTSTYGMVIPVVFGTTRITGNLMWYGDFIATPHYTETDSGGKGGGGGGDSYISDYTYSVSIEMGLCEGEIANIGKVWSGKTLIASLAASGLTLFKGTSIQIPWGYLTSAHPTEALAYTRLAYVAVSAYNLGNSDSLPNFSFEMLGLNIVSGLDDANPADIISAIVTNTIYGLGLSSSYIDVDDYYDYCMAANLLLSPAFTSQKGVFEHIQDLLLSTNSEAVWHDGSKLLIVPYGDEELTGNSVTWTPDVTPAYNLTDDDFLGDGSDDPIKVTRKTQADAFNVQQVEFVDRANGYNINTVKAQDQMAIDLYGLRPDSTHSMHHVTQLSIAQDVAQLLLQRSVNVKNIYEFSLDWRYSLLEPMGIVTITDSVLGMTLHPVRIIDIEEQEDNSWKITAEDFLQGVGTVAAYDTQESGGYEPNRGVLPGDINTPVIFAAPGVLALSGHEVWMAISGGANWGGCDIYASTDDITYGYIGRVTGAARYGELSAQLPAEADPDTTNTCAVDLTDSKGQLLSGTEDDCDNLVTLCLVGDELISYQTATLTAAYKYDLEDKLRRGVYNTAIATHAIAASFVRLDDRLFKYPFDPALIGQTIYLKFVSFNIYGQALQSLADVSSHSFVLADALGAPGDVASLTVTEPSLVIFAWAPVTGDIAGYEIRRNDQGALVTISDIAAGVCTTTDTQDLSVGDIFRFKTGTITGDYEITAVDPDVSFTLSDTGITEHSAHTGYEVNLAWLGATVVVSGYNGTSFATSVPAGDYTFLICAKDWSGNYSTTPATADFTVT